MKSLYIDCGMGAAGDMLTAALLELFPDKDKIVEELNAIGVPGARFEKEKSVKCGIVGTHMRVLVDGEEELSEDIHNHGHSHEHNHDHVHEHSHDDTDHGHEHFYYDHEHDNEHGHSYDDNRHYHEHHHNHEQHHHTSMTDIEHIVNDHLNLSDKVKKDVIAVYSIIAEAESAAHDRPVTEIHFHEVGNLDAIADISAVCYLLDKLSVENIVASPIHVGVGQVKCAHGILPVPAPATAYILKDVPIYGGSIRGELCTPTGAALLKHFACSFGPMPVMKTEKIGYGMGKKDFEAANCVRIMLGETGDKTDTIKHLSCNVDDMTGEEIGFCMDKLFEAGARDVYTESVYMKKNRPGTVINIICSNKDKDNIVRALFKYSSTIGIRETEMNRYVLERSVETIETKYGSVRCKVSSGYGVVRKKYEYEDLVRIANDNGISIEEAISCSEGQTQMWKSLEMKEYDE